MCPLGLYLKLLNNYYLNEEVIIHSFKSSPFRGLWPDIRL
jgi:hypothetical protein